MLGLGYNNFKLGLISCSHSLKSAINRWQPYVLPTVLCLLLTWLIENLPIPQIEFIINPTRQLRLD